MQILGSDSAVNGPAAAGQGAAASARRVVGAWATIVLAAVAAVAFVASTTGAAAQAAAPLWITKLCRRVPTTHEELAAAHAESKSSCIQVPSGDPLEVAGFSGRTEYGVTVERQGQRVSEQVPYDFSRLSAVSIGMRLLPEDQEQLPSVSKARILKRMAENYITIQLRLHRQHPDGGIYLYYKPFAAVGNYQAEQAQEFAPLMEDSVREVRSLGLFLKAGQSPSAENLRTLVAVNEDVLILPEPDGSGEPRPREHFELMFVRARVSGEAVELHTFVTNEFRRVLNYLPKYQSPSSDNACDLRNTIYFTEYTAAKQSPTKKVTRTVRIQTRGRYDIAALDAHAAAAGWTGSALDNLSETLDAIIDGRVPPRAGPSEAISGQ